MAHSPASGAEKKPSSEGRAYREALRGSLSDWQSDIGIALNALALFAFLVAILTIPISSIVGQILDYYRSLTSLFDPFERLFSINIPNYVRDVAVFWTISGAIGARTTLWFKRRLFEIADGVLKKAESDPESIRLLGQKIGKKAVEDELKFAREQRDFNHITPAKRRILYLGCILTGPLFFVQIVRVNPSLPRYSPVTGRKMVVIQLATLLVAFGVLFVLNWATL
jgi:hypothetical protein